MVDIGKLANRWALLVQRYSNGQRIERDEVQKLRDEGEPIPDVARPMLLEMIRGEYKFKRGLKPNKKLFIASILVDALAEGVFAQEKNPRNRAKEEAASILGTNKRTLEDALAKDPYNPHRKPR